jgi:hypothetical protein
LETTIDTKRVMQISTNLATVGELSIKEKSITHDINHTPEMHLTTNTTTLPQRQQPTTASTPPTTTTTTTPPNHTKPLDQRQQTTPTGKPLCRQHNHYQNRRKSYKHKETENMNTTQSHRPPPQGRWLWLKLRRVHYKKQERTKRR